ncbi:MAG: DUF3099 domain-containing protein [Actinomycetes bacterium]
MAGRVVPPRPPLITDARFPSSLSTDQRARRYMITMGFRVACFLAGVLSPTPWNVVLFVAAAILPGIAVLFGNSRDNRPDPVAPVDEDAVPALLPGGAVVRGEVVPGEARRGEVVPGDEGVG